MAKIEMYYRDMCAFCARADRLLASKGVEVNRINIWEVPGAREQMVQRTNGSTTVPQIFVDDRHIGGSDDLSRLEAQGKLDQLLQQ